VRKLFSSCCIHFITNVKIFLKSLRLVSSNIVFLCFRLKFVQYDGLVFTVGDFVSELTDPCTPVLTHRSLYSSDPFVSCFVVRSCYDKNRGSIQGRTNLSFHQGSDKLWFPPSLLYNGYPGLFPRGKAVAVGSSILLHGMVRNRTHGNTYLVLSENKNIVLFCSL
jgi:hypothetical protein